MAASEVEIPDAEDGLKLVPVKLRGESSSSSLNVGKPTSAKNKKDPAHEKVGRRSKEASKVKKDPSKAEGGDNADGEVDGSSEKREDEQEKGDKGVDKPKDEEGEGDDAGKADEEEEAEDDGAEDDLEAADDEDYDKCSISGL